MKKIIVSCIAYYAASTMVIYAAENIQSFAHRLHDAASSGNLALLQELNREGITLSHLYYREHDISVLQIAQDPRIIAYIHAIRDRLQPYAAHQETPLDHLLETIKERREQ